MPASSPQEALEHARSVMRADGTEGQINSGLKTLALALGAHRAEQGTVKALRAVVNQVNTPSLSDRQAWSAAGASKSNFMKWKRRVHNTMLFDVDHLLNDDSFEDLVKQKHLEWPAPLAHLIVEPPSIVPSPAGSSEHTTPSPRDSGTDTRGGWFRRLFGGVASGGASAAKSSASVHPYLDSEKAEDRCMLLQSVLGRPGAAGALGTLSKEKQTSAYHVALERQAARLRSLMNLQSRMMSDPDQAAKLLCAAGVELFNAGNITLYVVRHRSMGITPVASSHTAALERATLERSLSRGEMKRLLQPHAPGPIQHGALLVQAVASTSGEAVGVVELTATAGSFSEDDIVLLPPLLPLLAPALIKARNELSSKRAAMPRAMVGRESEQLLELFGEMSGHLEVQPLLAHIRQAAKEVMDCHKCTVMLVDRRNQVLKGRTSEEEGAQPFSIPINVGMCGYVAQTGETVNLTDA